MHTISLKAYEYMWSGDGPGFPRTNPVGYYRIPGIRPVEEISIYHHGTDQQPMWRYMVRDASGHYRSFWFFASQEDALNHALQDAILKTRLVSLRGMDEHIIDNIDQAVFLQEFEAGWCFYGDNLLDRKSVV